MRADTTRRPNLGDAMILVVAAALAMAITKQTDAWPHPIRIGEVTIGSYDSEALRATVWITKWISPWLVTLAVAVLVIRFRQPRPVSRRILCQPGALASTLGILALILGGLVSLARPALNIMFRLGGFPGPNVNNQLGLGDILADATSYGGTLILGSWLTLALAGRFRREPGWIDGLGIVVGSCWITTHLICWVSLRFFL